MLFGHQFKARLAHCTKNALSDHEFCPVFLQFLDCVYQITIQYPAQFEFNSKFLVDIAYHSMSLRFGTFLLNSEKERRDLKVRYNTVSLWSYINNRRQEYTNPFYLETDPEFREDQFFPDPLLPRMKLWGDFYMALSPFHSFMQPPMYREERVNL